MDVSWKELDGWLAIVLLWWNPLICSKSTALLPMKAVTHKNVLISLALVYSTDFDNFDWYFGLSTYNVHLFCFLEYVKFSFSTGNLSILTTRAFKLVVVSQGASEIPKVILVDFSFNSGGILSLRKHLLSYFSTHHPPNKQYCAKNCFFVYCKQAIIRIWWANPSTIFLAK